MRSLDPHEVEGLLERGTRLFHRQDSALRRGQPLRRPVSLAAFALNFVAGVDEVSHAPQLMRTQGSLLCVREPVLLVYAPFNLQLFQSPRVLCLFLASLNAFQPLFGVSDLF